MKENIINATIPVSSKVDAFETWLMITKALHKLTNEEIKVLAVFLSKRHELAYKIIDEDLLNENVFSTKNRKEVEQLLGFVNPTKLNNILSSMRKKGALKDNKIQPQFIPPLSKDFKEFIVAFKVKLDDKG